MQERIHLRPTPRLVGAFPITMAVSSRGALRIRPNQEEKGMNRIRTHKYTVWVAVVAALLALVQGAVPAQVTASNQSPTTTGGCQLASARGDIQHVVYIQFDNVHFTRDNPNVPSDLEQMPHLLNFITNNGVLLANHHTPLISHTATGILDAITGLYGDHHGIPIANSYRYFNANGTSSSTAAFGY